PTAPGTPKPLTENQARNTRFKGMRNGKPHPLADTTLGSSIPKSRSWTVTTSAPNRKGLTTDRTTQGKTTTTLVPLTPLLLPTIVTLILLSPLLVTIVRSSTSHKKELTGAPETSDSPPNIDTTPTELGYLCGGVRYAAETALAELYLRGKIRRENPNSPHFVLTEPENRTLTAQPVQDDIAHALRTEGPQKLPELIVAAQEGATMKTLKEGLTDKGLLSTDLRGRQHWALKRNIHSRSVVGILFGAGMTTTMLVQQENFFWTVGSLLAGVLAMTLGAIGVFIGFTSSGRWVPVNITTTGKTVVRRAVARHGPTQHSNPGDRVSLDQALHRVAVNGILHLARAPHRLNPHGYREHDKATPPGVAGRDHPTTDTGSRKKGNELEFDPGLLHRFVTEF